MTLTSKVLAGQFGQVVWLRVEGRGTFQVSPGVKDYVLRMIQRGRRSFVVDLAACELMDSTFMGTLSGIALRLREYGSGELAVIHANARNLSLLENLGLDHLFSFDLPDHLAISAGEAERACKALLQPAASSRDTILHAHRSLVEADPENEARFKDVLQLLERESNSAEGGI